MILHLGSLRVFIINEAIRISISDVCFLSTQDREKALRLFTIFSLDCYTIPTITVSLGEGCLLCIYCQTINFLIRTHLLKHSNVQL